MDTMDGMGRVAGIKQGAGWLWGDPLYSLRQRCWYGTATVVLRSVESALTIKLGGPRPGPNRPSGGREEGPEPAQCGVGSPHRANSVNSEHRHSHVSLTKLF